MARFTYANLTDGPQDEITPVWPCTLMIYSDERFEYGHVYIEVQRGDGSYQRYPALSFSGGTITPLDMPGATIRVFAENLNGATVDITDSSE